MTPAIIVAKGNSNRIPGKNKRDFCGKPLFLWSVEQALHSKEISSVYVSSDDEEILMSASIAGCEVILRPHEYTLTPANQAIQHALSEIQKKGMFPETFLCVLPTSPVRLPWDMDKLIRLHATHPHNTTGTCCEHLETIVYEPQPDGRMRTIMFDKIGRYYCDGGGMSVSDVDWYMNYMVPETDKEYDQSIYDGTFQPQDEHRYAMKEWQTPELDTPDHWCEAEAIMEACILQPLGRDCYKNYLYSEGENNG